MLDSFSWNFLVLTSLTSYSFLCVDIVISATVSPNRLRLCSKAETKDVDDSFCSRGWWLPNPIEPECVCVGGTWLLSENYCDKNFYLVSGPALDDKSGQEFSCFKIPSPLRRIASLTKQTNKYSQFFIESNGKLIIQLDKPDYSPEPKAPISIIRLNAKTEMYMLHREGVQASMWQKCLGSKENHGYTHIIKSEETISFLKSMNEDEMCDEVKDSDFPYSRSNDSDWIINRVGSFAWNPTLGLLPLNPCVCPPPMATTVIDSKPVVPETNGKRKGQAVSPNERDRNTDPDYDSLPDDSFNIYPKKRDPLLHAEHLNDNKRITALILSKLKDYIMLGIKPPPFNNPLFDYIRFGKKILTKFCPEINPNIIGKLIGLFRLLLGDIIGRYPEEYSLNVDSGVHQRVLQVLRKCHKGISNRTVKFSWRTQESDSGNCKEKKIVSFEVGGNSVPVLREKGKGGMPPRLKFVDGDVMLEVAWKVLMGAHYACSEYFAEYPEDLSFMYVKGQEFLTIPYVMFRWENPARGLTTAYKILNPDLNAHDLGEQIDACVFAAFDSSSYNSWLGRPESEKEFIPNKVLEQMQERLTGRKTDLRGFNKPYSNKKNRLAPRILDGKGGYCLSDFNDPIRWSQVDDSFTAITGC